MEILHKVRMTPKDFFLHLGAMVALYITVPTLLVLLFSIIDSAFPIVRDYYSNYTPNISFPVATLIVVFPIFLLLSWLLQKSYAEDSHKKNLIMRKWLLYITLFVSGIVIAGDLVTVIYYFLDGQLITNAFILKVIAVFVVATAVFVYYIFLLLNKVTSSHNKIAAVIASLAILAVIAVGFSVVGSPRTQRLNRYDEMKVTDLQGIQYQIINYWQQKGKLPEALSDLNDPLSSFMVPNDLETGAAYDYEKVTATTFKLCAEFNKNNIGKQPGISNSSAMLGRENLELWQHTGGQYCFERTIDPERYPMLNKTQQKAPPILE
ncbi:MAG: DUF5671 domain-containing protein [Patescibacteria group bacterium]